LTGRRQTIATLSPARLASKAGSHGGQTDSCCREAEEAIYMSLEEKGIATLISFVRNDTNFSASLLISFWFF
jgi:hypothetical protein